MKEVVDAFSWLIDQGKALYWGTSEWSAEEIQEAIGETRLGLISYLAERLTGRIMTRTQTWPRNIIDMLQ